MEFSVPLAQLPDPVRFPERLKERICFDAAKKRLVFQGFMTKCTYDELNALTDDAEYHRALEEIFVLTSDEVAGASSKRRSPAMALAAIGIVALVLLSVWVAFRYAPSSAARDGPRLSNVSR
jgi:hypothetical protein